MDTFKKIRGGWTEFKLYLNRANSYIIIINTCMLLFLMISRLKDYGWEISKTNIVFIFLVLISGLILLGWLDTKLGFFSEEAKRRADRNPYWKEALDGIHNIEKKLEKLEKLENERRNI